MIARASKKFLFYELARLTQEAGGVNVQKDSYLSEAKKVQLTQVFEEELKKMVVEVLNLVFGVGERQREYWSSILRDQIMEDYGFELTEEYSLENLPIGFLLAACRDNYGVRIDMKKCWTKIGTEKPFKNSDILSFSVKVKTFDIQNHLLIKYTNQYESFKQKGELKKALDLLDLRILLERKMKNYHLYYRYMAEKVKIMIETNNIKESLQLINQCIANTEFIDSSYTRFMMLKLECLLQNQQPEEAFKNYDTMMDLILQVYGDSCPLIVTCKSVLA